MGGDEVLEDRETLAEVRADRTVDDLALGVGHEASHTGELTDLLDVSTRAGGRHHVDGVEPVEVRSHGVADLVVRLVPDVDDPAVALVGVQEALLELLIDRGDRTIGLGEDGVLLDRNGRIPDGYGDTGAGRVVEPETLELVEDLTHVGQRVAVRTVLDDATDLLLVDLVVDEGVVLGQRPVEGDATD